MDQDSNESTVTEIDRQINEAQRRKESRGEEVTLEEGKSKPGRRRLSAEEKAQRDVARAEEKARKKALREEARARKRAEKEANARPAHMVKVEKAGDRLPDLSERSNTILQNLVFACTDDSDSLVLTDVEALIAHLNHFVRLERTKLALRTTVSVGQSVEITGGDARFIGSVGTVERVQRIRCYVSVDGQSKPVYLFTSDVRPLDGNEKVIAPEESPELLIEVAQDSGYCAMA